MNASRPGRVRANTSVRRRNGPSWTVSHKASCHSSIDELYVPYGSPVSPTPGNVKENPLFLFQLSRHRLRQKPIARDALPKIGWSCLLFSRYHAVLAVKTLRAARAVLGEFRYRFSPDGCAAP